MVDLPFDINAVLDGVELVVVSHLHHDHFDPVAHEVVPKDLPLLCQPGDEGFIRDLGFANVTLLVEARQAWLVRAGG